MSVAYYENVLKYSEIHSGRSFGSLNMGVMVPESLIIMKRAAVFSQRRPSNLDTYYSSRGILFIALSYWVWLASTYANSLDKIIIVSTICL